MSKPRTPQPPSPAARSMPGAPTPSPTQAPSPATAAGKGATAPPSPPRSPNVVGSPALPSDLAVDVDTQFKRCRENARRVRALSRVFGMSGVGPEVRAGVQGRRQEYVERAVVRRERKAARDERREQRRLDEEEGDRTGRTARGIVQDRQRDVRRRAMEEAGLLAAGRRRLGLAPVASEFTRADAVVPEEVVELPAMERRKIEMGGLLGVGRTAVKGWLRDGPLTYQPTDADRAWVAGARAVGATIGVIGKMLNLEELMMRQLFPVELAVETQAAVIAAGVKLLERALVDGDVGALRYWLDTHGGSEWRVPTGAAVQFGRDGRGNGVVTFVVEGFSQIGYEGGATVIDEVGAEAGVVSER